MPRRGAINLWRVIGDNHTVEFALFEDSDNSLYADLPLVDKNFPVQHMAIKPEPQFHV